MAHYSRSEAIRPHDIAPGRLAPLAVVLLAATLRAYVNYLFSVNLSIGFLPVGWASLFSLVQALISMLAIVAVWLVIVSVPHLLARAAGQPGSFTELALRSGYGFLPVAITAAITLAGFAAAANEVNQVFDGVSYESLERALKGSRTLLYLSRINTAGELLALCWIAYAVSRVHRVTPFEGALFVACPTVLLYVAWRLL